jgi:hypothetical protein
MFIDRNLYYVHSLVVYLEVRRHVYSIYVSDIIALKIWVQGKIIYIYVYICIYIHIYRANGEAVYIDTEGTYIYVYIHIQIYLYIYICMYI